MSKLELHRKNQTKNSTLGYLQFGSQLPPNRIWTLEDGFREHKVYGETRIPAGEYELAFRREGGFYERYCQRFNEDHPMIQLLNVPDFDYILVHPGSSVNDTRGCIITGGRYELTNDLFYVYDSTKAYLELRSIIIPIMQKEKLILSITEEFND